MLAELKELWKFRELLLSQVERELRIRYKNSFLGFFWSFLNPLIVVLVMTLVIKNFMHVKVANFSAYILAAYLPFLFFQTAILDSAQSVIANISLIKKIYFPREVLPLSAVISNFVHLILALAVFFVYLIVIYAINPVVPTIQLTSLYLPIVLAINFVLAAGLGLLVSALNTFYEDVKYIVGVLLYILFFLTPIMYFSENVFAYSNGGTQYTLYHLNPIAMLVTAYRKVLLAPQPVTIEGVVYPPLPLDWGLLGITALESIAILIFGYWVFNRLKWRFVERP